MSRQSHSEKGDELTHGLSLRGHVNLEAAIEEMGMRSTLVCQSISISTEFLVSARSMASGSWGEKRKYGAGRE